MSLTVLQWFWFIIITNHLLKMVGGGKGKIIFIKDGGENEINTKDCHSGVYLPTPSVFDCTCITGVWGFYNKFCEKPVMFIGGDHSCFRIDNITITQAALVGSFRYPFVPSISHFYDKYQQLTQYFSEEEHLTDVDAAGSWITITDMRWTLYGNKGDTVCLQPTVSGKRVFCLFSDELDASLNDQVWHTIVQVKQGCHSNKTVFADNCYKIMMPVDRWNCKSYPSLDPMKRSCLDADGQVIPGCVLVSPSNSTIEIKTREEHENGSKGWIPLYPPLNSTKAAKINNSLTPASLTPKDNTFWIPKPKTVDSTESESSKGPLTGRHDLKVSSLHEPESILSTLLKNNITDVENKTKTEIKNKTEMLVCKDLTRETVKEYWLDPANNECAKSMNEAVFTDQLRRFTATRFDTIFDSRLHSLEQMTQLVFHSRDIIKRTCGGLFVPPEFFNVAADAFNMFMKEDFFFGVEGVDSVSFDRILKSLGKCLKRARNFAFESKPLACELRKITGTLILPGQTISVTVPDNGRSRHFEPLIETTWKMFLNAHSYCYEDFLPFNDHHHFAVLFLELFSRTIYEKWIEPLRNKSLYKFVLPRYELMNEIMENLDYCIAATHHVSKCPVWLTRSSPLAKPITMSAKKSSRRKRSIWRERMERNRKMTTIWNNTGHCVDRMVEPSFSLGYAKCNQIF